MHENLLTPSNVIMYGRVVQGIDIDKNQLPTNRGSNEFLRRQIEAENQDLGPAKLARIYAISFEGSFYNLPKPMIFLVHGGGAKIRGSGVSVLLADALSNRPTADDSGMAGRDFDFEASDTGQGDGHDLRYWEYDKDDVTLRLDVVSGSLEDILVDAALSTTSKYAIMSRVDLTARVDLAGRADPGARVDLASRVDLMARNRLRA
jgi:hypothetical protein